MLANKVRKQIANKAKALTQVASTQFSGINTHPIL